MVYLRVLRRKNKLKGIGLLPAVLFIFALACEREAGSPYSRHPEGYYYRLLAFDPDAVAVPGGAVAWLSVSFSNQRDSVFWDSANNLNDRFYIRLDSLERGDQLGHFCAGAQEGDSASLLLATAGFYAHIFGQPRVPFFSETDSVVEVRLRLKRIFTPTEFGEISDDLAVREREQIAAWFGSAEKAGRARDPQGFYWVEKPGDLKARAHPPGTLLRLSYLGRFLNGRVVDAPAGDFEFIYGTPDQLLEGVNYVTGRLNLGQNAKIILPSRLAFGESGSSDRTVPPFTPLLYELNLKGIE